METNKIDIKSLSFNELEVELINRKLQKFRAKQIFDWLHNKKVTSFEDMTNISKDMIVKLNDDFYIAKFDLETKLVSKIDQTEKYLFKLADGNYIESVLMRYKHGNSLCISSQVGCKMGCEFCASTKASFIRNLLPSEMLEQVYYVTRETGERVSNIVLMGIGEPLDNYDNVVKFLSLISDDLGNNLSLRHISLSTCGLVDKIDELAELKLGLTLSISLHATTDELRSKTMPINNKYNIEKLIKSCRNYIDKTSRRISFEYALISDYNDSKVDADELVSLLKGMNCHLNLIPVNEIKEVQYKKANQKQVKWFLEYMNKKGINTTLRRTLGSDINGACGQLRRENLQSEGC